MPIDHNVILAKRVARDIGFDDWQEVLQLIRRVHGGVYSRTDEMSAAEYEALCDAVEIQIGPRNAD
jgi:hypothetical protein